MIGHRYSRGRNIMVLDIVVVVIVLGTMVQGYRHGFLQTFIHTVGWFVALVVSYTWSPRVKEVILAKTDFYEFVYNNVFEKVNGTMPQEGIQSTLPTIIQESVSKLTDVFSDSVATGLSDLLFTIISFLIVAIAVQLVLHLIFSLLSKEHNDGLPGFFDGFTGLLFGFIKGILLVFVCLAVMVPIASLADPKVMTFLMDNLENSRIAADLYNNNLILLVVRDFM
jgi:uncharacterized membrane protein required for colicin V production